MNTDTFRKAASLAVAALMILSLTTTDAIGEQTERWQAISAVKDAKTHLVPATWTLDKYPDAPTLAPRAKIVLLDQDGPGVVTLFHVSDYGRGDDGKLILRVWYDHEEKPSIEMPLMDFLGDIHSATKPYSTIHFSHVRRSHNFRLPMPFRRHVKIEVENPTDSEAIVRYEQTPQGGTRVAMVRARGIDRISFRESCRILLTYKHDLGEPYNSATGKGKAPALQPFVDGTSLKAPYRSCVYYYSIDQSEATETQDRQARKGKAGNLHQAGVLETTQPQEPLMITHTIPLRLLLAAICFHGAGTPRADEPLVLGNAVLDGQWTLDAGRITELALTNKHTDQTLRLETGHVPRIVLDDGSDDGRIVDLAALTPAVPVHRENNTLLAAFKDNASGLEIRWSAELNDAANKESANYVIQTLQLTATEDTKIKELVFIDTPIDGAKQVGRVDGSVVVCGDVFLAVEHPLAKNTVDKSAHVRCALPRGNVLKAGQTWRYTSVFGVVEPGQLRRGFLAYLERRRAHPYRPFLHYNSWYHLNIGRPDHHMTQAECLATIEHFGRELITKRGVKMDAFVWDDGWDDFNSLWGFHKDFPDGFRNLKEAGAKYGAAQGVWMSPWGGYGGPKQKRVAYGKSQGYETNRNGFSMAGPKYRAAFRDVCLKMMRHNGVVFFKFDGMGGGGGTGAAGELADDVDAVLNLTRELRKENPDLFISATVGTWASPFWTLYADSIWRQGGDTGFHGPGNGRQQWITYRDMFCYRCIVQWGPLYPLNSLMLHGPCIGERSNPARMDRDEESVADEIWTFFGSGTNLQELYISPHLLTPTMWDELAAAAKWSRANADVLVDTHWIGGDPGRGEVYGWASWQPRGGIVVLRNPSDKPGTYELELARDLELPDRHLTDYRLKSPRPRQRIDELHAVAVESLRIDLQPFEVLVFETAVVAGAKIYDAHAYRQRCAEREAARVKAARAAFQRGGVWEYPYQGHTYQRHFLPDGKAYLHVDGKRSGIWNGFTWRVEDDRLMVDKPDGSAEEHHLDDRGRLVLPAGLGTARKVP